MNLFIFNFNKTIFLFISLFIIYNLFLIIVKPNITILQNPYQKNYSFAQDFIYENNAQNIIVGSSMAARMKNEFLPDSYYNLSFSGGSVLTGLEIIKRSGVIPKNIYIENNIIFRKQDKKLLNSLFYPVFWELKKYIPALKEKYQPLCIVASVMKGSYGKSHDEYMKIKRNSSIYKMSIKRHRIFYSKKLLNYQEKLIKLKSLIKYFEKNNVNLIFFEMPIDSSLSYLTKPKEQRIIIKKTFQNKWIKLPNNNNYLTSDGIHLMYKSAYNYTKEFINLTKKDRENEK